MSNHCRFRLWAAALVFTMLMLSNVAAAEPSSVPIVLVLKLVSETRVQPTTGVVVSADGNVVVAADFVSEGDEIVVMDGGTDILKNARPAQLLSKSEAAGLALLSVQDMHRSPVRFAQLISPSEGDLHFAAFPDAERLAEGDPPLWLPVDVKPSPMRGEWQVTNVSSLPNIGGLVLDNCGQLAGIVLASSAQSPYAGQARMIMGSRLVTSLKQLDVSLSSVFCDDTAYSQRSAEEKAQQNKPVQESAPAPAKKPVSPSEFLDASNGSADSNSNTDPALPVVSQPALGTGESHSNEQVIPPSNPSIWSLVPNWLWWLIAALLAAIIFKLGTLWRLVNQTPESVSRHTPRHAPAVEPPTIELLAGSSAGPRNTTLIDDPMPDIHALPEGFNAIVSVIGQFGNGKSFARYCIVDKAHIDIIIGRGDADISIESPAVSRQHARLKGTASALTFSDLGSNNGTFIGAVSCLPGEIMFIEPDDEIALADVRFHIGVKASSVQHS